jgi:hypothetical protein
MKYSFRLYLKARISYANIPVVFEKVFDKYDIIDKSVYNRNRILLADNKEIKPFSEEWAKLRGMEPGYGGNIRLIIIINTI